MNGMKVLAVSSSPRKDGNSRLLAEAVLAGAARGGHEVELVDLAGAVMEPLRDCRTCRSADGLCSIDDGYADLLLGKVLSADALVLATPLYWYGVSGQLKIFIDRIVCYSGSAYPGSAEVKRRMMGKRMAVVVSSEESYPGAITGVTAQMQELARYLDHSLVGVVHGVANVRGEIRLDPAGSLQTATRIGERLFEAHVTDYRMNTPRQRNVWPEREETLPTTSSYPHVDES